jgi:phosphomethylpyrimidine synthase
MIQLQLARQNKITAEMKAVAKTEKIEAGELKKRIARGLVVIPANKNHKNLKPIGIGAGLKIKVNANIGTSPIKSDLKTELKKLRAALEAGADTIMDLSTGGNLDNIRKELIKNCDVPLGTVPIYQAAKESRGLEKMTIKSYLRALGKHAEDGVDFVTVHAGVTRKVFPLIKNRTMKCVSRGGSFLLAWMKYHRKENFLYENFKEILGMAKEYDMTLSLGDGLRPGCIADATDQAQIQELKILGELAERARAEGVQVMIEGPGHIPLNQIEKNVELEKKYCQKAPFYVLGPLPTDITAGYDHISCAIGGALAGWKGADFLCYVTPKEHLGLPDIGDVREGVVITKIAAQIADLARGNKEAIKRNYQMAKARRGVNWKKMLKYTIDPQRFAELRKRESKKQREYCSMCGEFCVFKTYKPR